jgi:hypothetical protein
MGPTLVWTELLLRAGTALSIALSAFLDVSTERGSTERGHQGNLQEATAPTRQPAALRFESAPGKASVLIPRAETLVYTAYLDVAVISANVGTVTQTTAVKQQAPSILLRQVDKSPGESATIQLEAEGEYLGYSLKSLLETSILPQEWPRLYYKQSSESRKGTRRREVMVGQREGAPLSSYRGDTSKGAPPGQRIWRAARERAVPAGTIDMLTAVFMARTLVRENADALSFPLIDTDRLWLLELSRSEERRMETAAGTFDVVEVQLDPKPYPGEEVEEKAKQFAGVFGIHGTIHLWVEKRTGIAVRIQGDLPIADGLITLGVDVVLKSYSGTPAEFAPVTPPKK